MEGLSKCAGRDRKKKGHGDRGRDLEHGASVHRQSPPQPPPPASRPAMLPLPALFSSSTLTLCPRDKDAMSHRTRRGLNLGGSIRDSPQTVEETWDSLESKLLEDVG